MKQIFTILGSIMIISTLLISCGGNNNAKTETITEDSKPSNYKLINKSDIPYVSDPWNDFLGFKNGETIGIVLKVGTVSGKLSIPFNYSAKNCWGNTNKNAELTFNIDKEISKDYFGKECLIIGTVDAISVKTPRDACDNTYASVTFKNTYFELFNESNSSASSQTVQNSEYMVGPDFKNKSQVYGTYCDGDCSFYIRLGDVNNIQTELNGISQELIDEALNGDFDGYAFINKGGGVTGVGFWKIKSIGEVTQKNNYPSKSAGEKFKGTDLSITWKKSGMDLEIYPDGIYQIRNSPNGLDWYDEQSSEKFKVSIAGTDGSVKFIKK